jgi:hypothetical protein
MILNAAKNQMINRDKKMEKVCCRCMKNEKEGQWIPVEVVDNEKFSYGFCPKCYQETLAEIKMATEHRYRKAAELRV